jgi:putative phage-type endonuclease
MEQRTIEWHKARLGRLTASRVADMMAKTRNGWGASRANYAWELAIERLTGEPTSTFCSPAMQWGTDQEDNARAAYQIHALCKVEEVGFLEHPKLFAGASPDGLIGDDGMVEIKCPNPATHGETLLTGTIADKYFKQMQFQMACAGRAWCDFVSYDPRFPEPMRLWVKRVERDDAAIKEIEEHAAEFLTEVAETVERLTALYGDGPSLRDKLNQSLEAA